MRFTLLIVLLSLFSNISCWAQFSIRDEIRENPYYSGSNNVVYADSIPISYTPVPKGKKAFYISHYGRHGSSFLIHKKYYDLPFSVLLQAQKENKLSLLGESTFKKVSILYNESRRRQGELTPTGIYQSQQILRRMFQQYPAIFNGEAHVDAKSTPVSRCILSMEYGLLELIKMNPQLHIQHNASEKDMYYMNLRDTALYLHKMNKESKEIYKAFYAKYIDYLTPMLSLFNDTAYAKNLDLKSLNEALFELATNAKNSEKGKDIDLFNIYTIDEIYRLWMTDNVWWYLNYGFNPYNGGKQPFSQRNLLRKIIEQADSCIALEKPGVTLRYGHDTMILPLVCLMNINGYGQVIDDMEKLVEQGWINYHVFPMAANIQFIFYRNNKRDRNVLVKVLLNEKEATLPLESKYAPYYRWKDVRKYYLDLLATYAE